MSWPGRILGGVRSSRVAAAGVWPLDEVSQAMAQDLWPTEQDPSFSSVVMLCHFEGGNGEDVFLNNGSGPSLGNSNTALLTLSSTQKKFGQTSLAGNASGLLRTNSVGIAGLAFGVADWTVEFWVYPTTIAGATRRILDMRNNGGTSTVPSIYVDTNGSIRLDVNGTDRVIGANGTLVINSWQHVAAAKVSGTTRLFVGGTQVGSNFTDGLTYGNASVCAMGGSGGAQPLAGFMDELRITKGVGRYSANFTPATSPFPDY